MKNDIQYENNSVSISLTDEEKDSFQDANIYLFEKENNNYKLLLKTNDYELDNNTIKFNNLKIIKTSNNEIISYIYEKEKNRVYGLLNDINVVVKLQNNDNSLSIEQILIDSKDKPVGGLVDYNNENINYYSINYTFDSDVVEEEWKENNTRALINNNSNELNFVENDLNNYYVLIEVNDINNDEAYSKIVKIQ